jgi:large subunit ribosomal protein L10
MALLLDDKKAIVKEVATIATQAHAAIVAEYRGLTVIELTELRKIARETGVYLRVIKNTLAIKAMVGTEFECMETQLTGPLIFAFSMKDPGCAARLISNFSKENDKLITKVIAIGGEVYEAAELKKLASLPNREQALGLLMSVMKAPIEKFVRTLAEPNTKMVRTITAIKDQKQAA